MGKFIWHSWAEYVSIFACVYASWSGLWGIIFRKFFWDFVDGTLTGAPAEFTGLKCDRDMLCGIIPSQAAMPFVTITVNAPVAQIAAIVIGLALGALEVLPALQNTGLYRSFIFKGALLFVQAFMTVLYYQGTNAAIYSTLAGFGYFMAHFKGEEVKLAKDNRGRGGEA